MPATKEKKRPKKNAKKNAKKKARKKSARRKKGWRTAATSDIHELYELSVQEPDAESDFIDQVWKELRTRKCRSVREDFCGTAAASIAWVKHRRANTGIGVDIDPEVLDWGRQRIGKRLSPAEAKRLTLVQGDVRTAKTALVDTLCAMNFSYYCFKTRDGLREYFKAAHANLVEDGLFLLDAYGGSESFIELEEERDLDSFTYVWDQHSYDPITGDAVNHIHFKFPDGTKIKKAFSYEWRLWTLPEIQEVLIEAGFRDAHVYWEGTDKDGEGDGNWTRATVGEACQGWIAYIVGVK